MNRVGVILLVVLLLMLVFALPVWPHAAAWGYWPSGGIGVLLVVLLIFVIAGVIR